MTVLGDNPLGEAFIDLTGDEPTSLQTSSLSIRDHSASRRLGAVDARRPRRATSALTSLFVTDIVALCLAAVLGQLSAQQSLSIVIGSVVYVPVFVVVFGAYSLYRRGRRRLVGSSFPDLSPLAHALVMSSLVILLFTGLAHRLIGIPLESRRSVVVTAGAAMVLVLLGRGCARRLGGTRGGRSRVMVIGSGLVASQVAARIKASPNLALVGCVDDNSLTLREDDLRRIELLGGLDDLPTLIDTKQVDRLVVAFSPVTESEVATHLRALADVVQISVVPRMFDLLTVRSNVDDLAGLPVMDVAPPALGPADRLAKRAIDIAVSAAGLLVLSPVFLVISLAVKLTSPGSILFSQQRTGRGGRPFRIYKFRSMRSGAESLRQELASDNEVDGPLFKIHHDPRVTPLGKWLRKTSLDELPQLINVLKGDMSLVGPRPFVTAESAGIDGWAARRFDVRPGVTGLWQISGRNDLPFDELRRLDYSYVASWSLWWDLQILWHTPASVFRHDGAY